MDPLTDANELNMNMNRGVHLNPAFFFRPQLWSKPGKKVSC